MTRRELSSSRTAIHIGLITLYLAYSIVASTFIRPAWVIGLLAPVWFFGGYGASQIIGRWLDGR